VIKTNIGGCSNMTGSYDFSELDEMIRLGFREQAMHPKGLNSSQTHGTLYPAGDPRNKQPRSHEPSLIEESASVSSKLMHIRAGSRQNWL
tara:strand:+ start:453 stop:722 length:270 start_codon:yes stop_codon:yes gene_type:complete